MNVNLHIERLVLDGLDLEGAQRSHVQTEVEAELTRLFTANGAPPNLAIRGSVPHVLGSELHTTPDGNVLGQRIAQSVYEGLAP